MTAIFRAVAPFPHSLGSFVNHKFQFSISRIPISGPIHGVSSFNRTLHAALRSTSDYFHAWRSYFNLSAEDVLWVSISSGLTFQKHDSQSVDAVLSSAERQSEIIFLGTGTSEGIPRVSCLTDPVKKCPVCTKAAEPGNKNKRLNTSILICHHGQSGKQNILIDAGKFFYHSALRWFPAYGIRRIDAVIITHSHADAIGGLDDLRDWTNNVQPSIPIYVAQRDFEVMKKTHYYIVDTSVIIPGAAVSELEFKIIDEEPFSVQDLKITPLPVWHGKGYRSLGFRFGNVCYISDVSDIPAETYPLLEDCELLVVDALRPDRSSSTHFGLPRSLEEVRKIRPKRTLFTGMMHLMDHEKVNEYLRGLMETEGLDVQLSYDGLRVPLAL